MLVEGIPTLKNPNSPPTAQIYHLGKTLYHLAQPVRTGDFKAKNKFRMQPILAIK